MRLKFRIVGQTSDNKLLFAGVFEFYNTNGLPLDVLFDFMIKKGWMPSWIDFYEEALKAGWKHKTIETPLLNGWRT